MSIRGIIAIGLLDSPSEMITLGLDAASATPPDGPGITVAANIDKPRAAATIAIPRTAAAIDKSRSAMPFNG